MELEILRAKYEVIETDIETLKKEAQLEEDNSFFYGAMHFPTQRIFLNNELSTHVMKKTLRHELCHAFLFESGHNLECVTEETICDVMGAFAEDICNLTREYFERRDNPQTIAKNVLTNKS